MRAKQGRSDSGRRAGSLTVQVSALSNRLIPASRASRMQALAFSTPSCSSMPALVPNEAQKPNPQTETSRPVLPSTRIGILLSLISSSIVSAGMGMRQAGETDGSVDRSRRRGI